MWHAMITSPERAKHKHCFKNLTLSLVSRKSRLICAPNITHAFLSQLQSREKGFNSQFDSSLLAGSPHEDFCFCFTDNSTEDEVVVRSSRRVLSCGLFSVRLQRGKRGKGDKDGENGRDQLVNTGCQAAQHWEPGSCLVAHPATETAGGKNV